MGVPVRIQLYAGSREASETAARAAFARVAQLDTILSDWLEESELNRLARSYGSGPVKVSDDLFRVLWRSQELAQASNGAFDVTAGPLVRLWRETRRAGQLPFRSQVLEARGSVGWRNLRLERGAQTAEVAAPGMQLDLGGIAKGYVCDAAVAVLRSHGVRSALVEAGGDMAASDAPPGTAGWRIEVRNLPEPILLRNGGLSTSGDSEQFVELAGRRFSHILDPRTGYGLTTRVQVTVVAKDAFTSDGLATAASVLGREGSARLLRQYKARAIFLSESGT
jgi:FAD:protein FMN transferase